MSNNKQYSAYNIYLIIGILLSTSIATAQKDIWIDKNESKNYQARHECSFVQAGETFIMFGGREKAQKLDLYNFKTNTWGLGGTAPKQFNHFQATFYKGFVWVIGSFKTNTFPKEIPANYVWLYYPPTKTWIRGSKIPESRQRGGAGLVVYKDIFYLIGGNTKGHDGGYVSWFDAYDPKTNTWLRLENASRKRDHFSAAIIGHTLYAVGGRQSGGKAGVFAPLIATVDTYNFKTKKWSILNAPLPTPRAAPSVAVFKNKLYVMGGEGTLQGPAFKTLEVYNPKTKAWTTKEDMHYPRHGTQAIVSGKGIYIAGGSPTRGGGNQLHMEVYNKDKPKGTRLITSRLHAKNEVVFKTGTTKKIYLQNKGGNTGSFITSMTLNGINQDKFKIKNPLNLMLINPNKKTAFEVQHIGNASQDKASITITYNTHLKTVIQLLSK